MLFLQNAFLMKGLIQNGLEVLVEGQGVLKKVFQFRDLIICDFDLFLVIRQSCSSGSQRIFETGYPGAVLLYSQFQVGGFSPRFMEVLFHKLVVPA